MNARDEIGGPESWLQYANDDLRAAVKLLAHRDISPSQSCYHAQQAAEKALKAALICMQTDFPYTHNLETLLELLPTDWNVQNYARELATLTEYAVTARYPGDWTPPTEAEANEAVNHAQTILASIQRDIETAYS